MQIVIDISEETYEYWKEHSHEYVLSEAIKNGIPLPKGHGRLIEQPTDTDIEETIGGQNDFADCIKEAVATVFENAETIVEADGGDI